MQYESTITIPNKQLESMDYEHEPGQKDFYRFLIVFYLCLMNNRLGIVHWNPEQVLSDLFGIKATKTVFKKFDDSLYRMERKKELELEKEKSGWKITNYYSLVNYRNAESPYYTLVPAAYIKKFHQLGTMGINPEKACGILNLYCLILSHFWKYKASDSRTKLSNVFWNGTVADLSVEMKLSERTINTYLNVLDEIKALKRKPIFYKSTGKSAGSIYYLPNRDSVSLLSKCPLDWAIYAKPKAVYNSYVPDSQLSDDFDEL